jgi:hypothetical protein
MAILLFLQISFGILVGWTPVPTVRPMTFVLATGRDSVHWAGIVARTDVTAAPEADLESTDDRN